MRIDSHGAETPKIPIPDIEQLFIGMLQFNQAAPGGLSDISKWISLKHPEWKSPYTFAELHTKTLPKILDIVLGLGHRDVKMSPEEIRRIALQDADQVIKAIHDRGPADPNTLLITIFDNLIIRDFEVMGVNPYSSENFGTNPGFEARPRREGRENTAMKPQRDPWQSNLVFFVLMTPEERAEVHGPGYNLHFALEELCDELRRYLYELSQKENRTDREEWRYRRFLQLKNMWDEHHAKKAELKPAPNYEI